MKKNLSQFPRSRPAGNHSISTINSFFFTVVMLCTSIAGCSKGGYNPGPQSDQNGEIRGSVKDQSGNPYPSTSITISKGNDENTKSTNPEGIYSLTTTDIGSYEVEMELPLSAEAISENPAMANVQADQVSTVDFVIKTHPVEAHINFGNVQLLEEIVNLNGNTPVSGTDPLYAKNIFDAPLGMLTAIKAPDGHHVTLSEFKKAKGEIFVNCNGKSSMVEISLEGMIPNGTYTFWLAYLKKKRKVSESIDFANDFVNFTNPPIGPSDGSGNVVVAAGDGTVNVTLEHPSCILTDHAALVIPVLYHINGKTFGGGHVPDAEEMVHMLIYFQ